MADERGLLRIAAAAAAAVGVFAAVTGHSVAAAVAGACALVSAVLALRVASAPRAADSPVAIDLREAPVPPAGSASSTPPPDPSPLPDDASAELLGEGYIAAALRGRIAVARRALRPLSVVHIMITGGDEVPGPVPAGLIAAAAEATLRESDIVGRRDDGVYVCLLEDTAEDGAVWTTERLRRHIAGTIGPRRFQAGVASYPNHGLDAPTVDASAAAALSAAQEWDRDRIEVAAGR